MLAEQRKRRLRKTLITTGIVVGVLAVVTLVYQLFLAPPPEVREAYRLESAGENLAVEGDLRGALSEFEKAAEVLPDQGTHWIWIGVLNDALGEPVEAEEAFERARPLFESEYEYLLQRAQAYSRVGDVDAALADADQAIALDLDSGTGYYVRHSIHIAREDYASAYADLEQAAALAHKAGDVQLEATARVQLAMLIQQMSAAPVPTSEPVED
jgi:tetratricopeptide (TPR) repeat protein